MLNFNSLILILVMPARNAVSKRSFSALCKDMTAYNYWTSPTLNWCLTLHAHKEGTDALSMTSIANECVSRNPTRMNIFGIFKD